MRVLFVDIDTLRPDHMGCYGYYRNTTPAMDEIAREGMRFDCCYCSDAPCLPSRAALISGMFGIRNGAVGHGGTCGDRRLYGKDRQFRDPVDESNFNNIFRKAGMHTVSVSTFPERHSSYWFNAGFNETYNVGKGGNESGEEVLPVVLNWLDRRGGEDNWYLHMHLWDPHTPYRTPEGFSNPFADQPLETWITPEVFKLHLDQVGPHGLNEINMYDDVESAKYPKHPGSVRKYEELRRILDGYDCGVRYADMLVCQVFDRLKALGIYDDTAIIITSDHGENLGELGIYAEHGTADQPTCHIPMIIKWPGGAKGTADGRFHYLLDLAPTMAELLGVPASEHWDGESFAGNITSGQRCGRKHVVLSQMAHVCQRSAVFGDWLYMRTYHDGFRLLNREMLFHLKDDPYMQRDLKDAHPDVCAQGAKIILDWHDDMMLKSSSEIDPMWTVIREGGPYHTVGALNRYLEHLEKTGRAEGAQKLREKYHA